VVSFFRVRCMRSWRPFAERISSSLEKQYQHLIPFATLRRHLVEEGRVVLGRNPLEQELQGWLRRAHSSERGRRTPAQCLRAVVDLNDVAAGGQEVRERIVGSDHQQ